MRLRNEAIAAVRVRLCPPPDLEGLRRG